MRLGSESPPLLWSAIADMMVNCLVQYICITTDKKHLYDQQLFIKVMCEAQYSPINVPLHDQTKSVMAAFAQGYE